MAPSKWENLVHEALSLFTEMAIGQHQNAAWDTAALNSGSLAKVAIDKSQKTVIYMDIYLLEFLCHLSKIGLSTTPFAEGRRVGSGSIIAWEHLQFGHRELAFASTDDYGLALSYMATDKRNISSNYSLDILGLKYMEYCASDSVLVVQDDRWSRHMNMKHKGKYKSRDFLT